MSVKFVANYPVLFISELQALVIADLHIGLEYDLYKSGIVIPSQAEKFVKILKKIINMTKAKQLIILGDIKYKVPGSTIREDILIPRFLHMLEEKVKIVLCKGNHDDDIEGILPEGVKLYGSKGFSIGKYGFFHGHAWPGKKLMQCNYLFMGHLQPTVEFVDKFRHRNRQRIWLKGNLGRNLAKEKFGLKKIGKLNIIVFPAFNNLSGSLPINVEKKIGGPLISSEIFNIKESRAYLLDGTYLGDVEFLIKKYKKVLLEPF